VYQCEMQANGSSDWQHEEEVFTYGTARRRQLSDSDAQSTAYKERV